jgi:hypothetical protein
MKHNSATATLLVAFLLTLLAGMIVPATAQRFPGVGTVMTYNVNEGTDFQQVVGTETLQEFLLGVGQVITQVQGTNPPERMQAVAKQILTAEPELLSIQEVDQWYTGTFDPVAGTCSNMTLQYDMVQELLDDLSTQGGHYEIAAQVIQYAFPPTPGLIPPTDYICVSVNDYNLVLTRTDLPTSVFEWSNPQTGLFVNEVVLQTPIGPVTLPRSWASVDAKFFGHPFRYVNTHLESFDASIRELQGSELRAGPAKTTLPVVIGMDSNAQAFPLPLDPTYSDFISAGYNDAWSELFPEIAGLTCCQDETDNNPVPQLYQRIDLVLTLGKVDSWDVKRIGAGSRNRLPDGLWPSDHTGVEAGVTVGSR